ATCTVVRVVAASDEAAARVAFDGPLGQVVAVVEGTRDGIATLHAFEQGFELGREQGFELGRAQRTGHGDAQGTGHGGGQGFGLGPGHAFTLPWTSPAMIENALLALTLATRLGRSFDAALDGLRSAVLEPGRLQWRRLEGALLLDDSYNANPASAEVALQALRAAPRPWVAFLGDMLELGDTSREAHRLLGETTSDLDVVVFVGPESRVSLAGNPKAQHREDAAQARDLVADIPGGATVLVKGSRGMHMERVVEELLLRFGPERSSERSSVRVATNSGAPRTEATS
ncbi:MAG: cyanophycin synthetase, partial [Trueperaceae bacterium]